MMRSLALAMGVTASLAVSACSSSSTSGGSSGSPAKKSTSASMSMSKPTSPAASGGATSAPPATTSGIVIKNFAFSGKLTVKAGAKVTVTNQDSAAHTVTSKTAKLFDTGNIAGSGGTGTFTAPAKPGSYPFGCRYHSQMAGTLIVK